MKLNNLPQTIYIFTDWYIPGYRAGGPIQSVYNLVKLLSKHFHVKVISRNTDYGNIIPFADIIPDKWILADTNHEVIYLSTDNLKLSTIRDICKSAKNEIVFINGIFSFYFSVLPLFFANYYNIEKSFISVRGMLHQSALKVKPLKKQVFLAFARGFGLYRKTTLLFSSPFESEEIFRSLRKVRTRFAPNIPIQPVSKELLFNKVFKDFKGTLRLLFLGRISPEKNPLAVLKALREINYPVSVTFIGTSIDQEYGRLFESEIQNLPDNINSLWIKELPHQQILELFSQMDILILPSYGENFGHAIFESFANGTPVIIGNNTPWRGLESLKAGLEIEPDNTAELLRAVNKFNAMSAEEYKLWQNGSLAKAMEYFDSNNFEKTYLDLLESK